MTQSDKELIELLKYSRYNPKKTKPYYFNKIRSKYSLTIKMYFELLKYQHGVCAICKKPETATDKEGNIKNLCVDHNHKTGEIRGLLCNKCNWGLGLFKENIESLENAIKYLKTEIDWVIQEK